jgi:hypothetical protein
LPAVTGEKFRKIQIIIFKSFDLIEERVWPITDLNELNAYYII